MSEADALIAGAKMIEDALPMPGDAEAAVVQREHSRTLALVRQIRDTANELLHRLDPPPDTEIDRRKENIAAHGTPRGQEDAGFSPSGHW